MTRRNWNRDSHLPNIIIEGPDGGGKTTASRELVDWLGYAYRHDGPPPSDITDNILDYYYILYESFPRPFVWDRSIFGELVYGPIFRGRSRLIDDQVTKFYADFRHDGGTAILLIPPMEVILAAWRGAEQQRKSVEGTEAARHVKRTIIDDVDKLQRIHDSYVMIKDMFDYVIPHFINRNDWIRIISHWMRGPRHGT